MTVVLVEGEAGIGKSRLLAEALDRAGSRGWQIAAARAEELERSRPFGALADAFGCVRGSVDPRRSQIAALLATHDHLPQGGVTVSSDQGLQYRVVDAFADLAEELALSRPLILAVDDLHWADPATILTIGVLAQRLRLASILIVGCLRPGQRPSGLRRLLEILHDAGAQHLRLTGLDESGVRALAADLLERQPEPRMLHLLDAASGNPLYLTELLTALRDAPRPPAAPDRRESGHAPASLPSTLQVAIRRRLSALGDETVTMLRTGAILGSRFSLPEVSIVAGRPAVDLARSVAEALIEGVLDDDGEWLRFRHDLIRDAIYDDMPAALRVGLHREAGQRLAAVGASSLRVAQQLVRAAAPGDLEAVSWLARAATETIPRSAEASADLLEQAIDLLPVDDRRRDDLLAQRAELLLLSGRIADAERTCRSVLSREHDPAADGPVRITLAHALAASGHAPEGLRELETVASSSQVTPAQRATARAWAGICLLTLGDLAGAAATAERAGADASEAADHLSMSIALSTQAVVAEMRGRPTRALEIIEEAVRLADRSPDRVGHRYPLYLTQGHVLLELGQLEGGRAVLTRGLRLSEQLGMPWPRASYQAYLAVERLTAGEWDDAVTEFEAALVAAAETGESYSLVLTHTGLGLLRLHRNDLTGAAYSLGMAERLARSGPEYFGYRTGWVRALLLEARGDAAGALSILTGVWDRCVAAAVGMQLPVLGPDLIRMSVQAGERSRMGAVVGAIDEVAASNDVPWLTGAALRCRGMAEGDADLLEDAVAAYTAGDCPLELGLACQDAGAARAAQTRTDAARDLLGRAAVIFERLDASRDLARTEAALRRLGVRRGRRGARQRPSTGWASLTPTEHAVAAQVVEGLTNAQIGARMYLSRRTVQTHLVHIFAKLGVGTRAALAAEVARRDGRPGARS